MGLRKRADGVIMDREHMFGKGGKEMKQIIHIDMDAFYASIEERDNPKLIGKPLVVGGRPGGRGVVATCSYEARKYGIHSAMPAKTAYALCPQAIFIHPRHDYYHEVSRQIRSIFRRYTDKIEPLSLDEAYLDVTTNKIDEPDAVVIAKRIKKEIKEELGLTASAGVSYNKFLAKIASDYQKPDGLTIITEEKAQNLLDNLAIEKFFGVGRVTATDLKRIGVRKGKDLRALEREYLLLVFGKRGQMLYDFARGIDFREVEHHRVRKSVGSETTFEVDIALRSEALAQVIEVLAQEVAERLQHHEKKARTITVKVKFEDFTQITRSMTIQQTISTGAEIHKYSKQIIDKIEDIGLRIRLLGITVSHLMDKNEEVFVNLSLFDE